jgi:hypothetical protein
MKELLVRQARLNAALDLDKGDNQVAPMTHHGREPGFEADARVCLFLPAVLQLSNRVPLPRRNAAIALISEKRHPSSNSFVSRHK